MPMKGWRSITHYAEVSLLDPVGKEFVCFQYLIPCVGQYCSSLILYRVLTKTSVDRRIPIPSYKPDWMILA
jgi:hypothetical protein